MKAGKIVSGEFMTDNAIKTGMAEMVILASDCSDNTKKKFRNSCEFYEIPYVEYGDKDSLGHCIGKEFRACLAVTDYGFASSLKKELEKDGGIN